MRLWLTQNTNPVTQITRRVISLGDQARGVGVRKKGIHPLKEGSNERAEAVVVHDLSVEWEPDYFRSVLPIE